MLLLSSSSSSSNAPPPTGNCVSQPPSSLRCQGNAPRLSNGLSHFARGGEIFKSEEREREWEDGRSAMDWLSHGWEREEVSAGGRKWGRILRGRSWTKRETFDPPLIRPSKPSFKDIQETSQGPISSISAHKLSNPNQTDFRI